MTCVKFSKAHLEVLQDFPKEAMTAAGSQRQEGVRWLDVRSEGLRVRALEAANLDDSLVVELDETGPEPTRQFRDLFGLGCRMVGHH